MGPVESSAIAAVGKYLWIPFIAVFSFFAKQFFNGMEEKTKELVNQQSELKSALVVLEKDLNKNYYDKQEIKEHITEPLMDKFLEANTHVKAMTSTMNDIHSDMAILKYKILGEELKSQ